MPPSPLLENMPNITLADLTGRGYDVDGEAAFEKRVVCTGVKDDWWILEDKWHQLLRDLSAMGSEATWSWKKANLIIDGVDKDLPAHARARFPTGSRNFVRVSGKAKSTLQWLATHKTPRKSSGSQRWRFYKCFWDHRRSDKKRRLREAAGFCYDEAMARVAGTKLPLYTRSIFETEFDLVWNY